MSTLRRAAVAAVLITLSAPALAQDLAVGGRTPANPLLIVSVTDSPSLWKSLGESKFGQLLESKVALPGMTPMERGSLEKSLDFSLEPADLFTQTVKGFDVYLLEVNDEPGFVVNFQLRDASTATKILDQVKKECSSAQGSAGGVSASTVVDTTTNKGVRQLSLPAFRLYLAADGSTLLWSNQRESMESAFKDEGKAIFTSEYFKRYMDELKGDPGKVWMFGEIARLAPLTGTKTLDLGPVSDSTTLGAKIDADKTRLKMAIFQHVEDMPSASKRYTLTAPPAGDVGIVNYFPEGTNFLFGTNHFDGTSILEMVTESAKGDNAPLSAKQIDERVASGKALLGFDAKEDVLANLGPDLGFGLTTSAQSKDAKFPFDLFMVSHVKNRDRFEAVLESLEASASASAAPAPRRRQPKSVDPNAATPSPTPEPTPAVQAEEFEGETIRFASSVPGASGTIGDVQPGYAFTKDDYFIFALNKNTIKSIISASKGSKGMADTSLMKDVNAQLGGNRNGIMVIDGKAIHDILDANKDKLIGLLSAEQKAHFDEAMNYLGSIRALSSASTYTSTGKKQEVVLLF
ncbi:hypothetical protein IT570_12725 [Candidatus Sumerlaeota bacterium]|nr:hypothetical protein [Candidatus Sumerlaeota bacterium]